jgi:hypothetical protein
MEIRSAWSIPDPALLQSLSSHKVAFSPDGQIVCFAVASTVHFFSDKPESELPLPGEGSITCLATVTTDPWVLCAGFSAGSIVLFHRRAVCRLLQSHSSSVQNLRACFYLESRFTRSAPFLLISHDSSVIATVPINPDITDSTKDVVLRKWTLRHLRLADCALINSKLDSPLFFERCEFPGIVSVGSQPFLALSSIARAAQEDENAIIRMTKSLFSWFSPPPKDTEVVPPDAPVKWELNDERWAARELSVSEDGRWMAVADGEARVSIIDPVFGHITRTLKGYRDAQMAWSHPNILLVFSPARKMIVACTAPNGELFDAVNVDPKGKLFQGIGADRTQFGIFLDGAGKVIVLSVNLPKPQAPQRSGEDAEPDKAEAVADSPPEPEAAEPAAGEGSGAPEPSGEASPV